MRYNNEQDNNGKNNHVQFNNISTNQLKIYKIMNTIFAHGMCNFACARGTDDDRESRIFQSESHRLVLLTIVSTF